MMFGNSDTFAIEIGVVEKFPTTSGTFVQFRFWIEGIAVGDWDDRIPLDASVENAKIMCANVEFRREIPFGGVPASTIFKKVYDEFFDYDYTTYPVQIPTLRDRFHLDDIGMGAIQDKYGIVLVASSGDFERLIVKDFRVNQIVADALVHFGLVESVTNFYIRWAQAQKEGGAD